MAVTGQLISARLKLDDQHAALLRGFWTAMAVCHGIDTVSATKEEEALHDQREVSRKAAVAVLEADAEAKATAGDISGAQKAYLAAYERERADVDCEVVREEGDDIDDIAMVKGARKVGFCFMGLQVHLPTMSDPAAATAPAAASRNPSRLLTALPTLPRSA